MYQNLVFQGAPLVEYKKRQTRAPCAIISQPTKFRLRESQQQPPALRTWYLGNSVVGTPLSSPSFSADKCFNFKSLGCCYSVFRDQIFSEVLTSTDRSSFHTYNVLFLHIRWYISLLLIPMLCCLSCSSVV